MVWPDIISLLLFMYAPKKRKVERGQDKLTACHLAAICHTNVPGSVSVPRFVTILALVWPRQTDIAILQHGCAPEPQRQALFEDVEAPEEAILQIFDSGLIFVEDAGAMYAEVLADMYCTGEQ